MFGYIQANTCDLSTDEKLRYKSVYCGICHSIGDRYGNIARMGLSYDLTFLALLCSSLYEPACECTKRRCVIHPCKSHSCINNKYIDYAADMTVALMYHKCLDDWNDDRNIAMKCYASLLLRSYNTIKKAWPEQCRCIERELETISGIERNDNGDADAASKSFGRLMACVFAPEKDNWKSYLEDIGYGLGRYIYIADAAVDLKKDIKKGSYNPLKATMPQPELVKSALKIMLGESSKAFEALPLEEDLGLLRNILYSGVWIKYNRGMQKRKGRKVNGE